MRKDPFLCKSFLCGGGDPFLEIDILVCIALGGMPSLRARQFRLIYELSTDTIFTASQASSVFQGDERNHINNLKRS
jgi:hypothetical protein